MQSAALKRKTAYQITLPIEGRAWEYLPIVYLIETIQSRSAYYLEDYLLNFTAGHAAEMRF